MQPNAQHAPSTSRNTPAANHFSVGQADWSKLAWPAAILISIAGAAVGRADTFGSPQNAPQPPQQNSQAQPASNSGQSQATAQPPTQTQTQAQAQGQPQNPSSQPVDASLSSASKSAQPAPSQSWSAEPQQTHIQEQPVSDPFSGRPSTSVAESSDGRGEVRSVKSIRPNAVKVDDNGVVDLRVNGEEVTAVLEMLSLQSQKNIIPYKNVNGKVFANLYGVTFYEALDALLHANGFGYVERGNFIYVYTLEDLQKLEKESRQRVWKVIKLNYLSAVDAASFAQALLSKDSVIKTNAKIGSFPAKSDVPIGAEDYVGESTIMVYDFPEQVEQIEKLVKELDTRPAQVLVEATILQAQLTENNAFGVDFAVIGNLDFGSFLGVGGPLRIPDAMLVNNSTKLINGSPGDTPVVGGTSGRSGALGIASTAGNVAGPGTMKVGLYSNDVGVFIKMLDEVTDTTILSNPKILALNRQPARVLIGERVGYLNTTSTNTATTQSVEFLDTGTQLHFRPFVGSDNTIRLELKPSVSSAVVRDVKNSTGGTVTVPDEITNELTTNVIVRDGQTVVLGGLFRESTQTTRRQVPLLGDVPLVGTAFRGQEDTVDRNEIIFLITPSIVTDTFMAESGDKTHDMLARVRAGAREGLLPFSRERMTSQMLMDARKLASDGKTDQALWKLRMALSINPHQEEAIELQNKLTGKTPNWPSNSMLDDLLDTENRARAGMQTGMKVTPDGTPAVPPAPKPVEQPAPTPPPPSVSNASEPAHAPKAVVQPPADTTTAVTTPAATPAQVAPASVEIPAGAVTAAAPSDSGNPSVAAESATPAPAAVETPVAATVAATPIESAPFKPAVAAKYSTMSWSQFARPMQPRTASVPQNASPAVSTVPETAH
ncbi:MAG: secretin N-terminal domain-containing protein [Phycisphaerales bacterium]|nr:hypothetical protein [Planctomycetota bacterium]